MWKWSQKSDDITLVRARRGKDAKSRGGRGRGVGAVTAAAPLAAAQLGHRRPFCFSLSPSEKSCRTARCLHRALRGAECRESGVEAGGGAERAARPDCAPRHRSELTCGADSPPGSQPRVLPVPPCLHSSLMAAAAQLAELFPFVSAPGGLALC